MKKSLFLILMFLLSSSTASAIYFEDEGMPEGYRGFVDLSYTLSVGDGSANHDRVGLMTSHGYQIAPQFFAGLGVGFNYFYEGEAFNLPVFAHFRSDILENEITPYVDLRVGYSFLDIKGFYLNPGLGCRFELNDNLGLSVGVGYTMQKVDGIYPREKINFGGIDFRFGIDF